MCFYLYAPNGAITIDYKSEIIALEDDGTSSIVADCLITNNSPNSINKINIIYPNKLDNFEDLTSTFLDNKNDLNSAYKDCFGMKTQRFTTSEGEVTHFAFYYPDDNNGLIAYEGRVEDIKDALSWNTDLKESDRDLLCQHYFTVLSYNFRAPIAKDEKRWIRLKFDDIKTAKTSKHANWIWLLRLTNNLFYQYLVLSPHTVKQNFVDKIQELNLSNCFKDQGLCNNASSTIFKKVRIQANPGKLEQFTHYRETGKIKPTGTLPKYYYVPGQKYYTYYQWESESVEKKDFTLEFQSKPFYLPYYLLSTFAVMLSSTALVLAIFRIFGILH